MCVPGVNWEIGIDVCALPYVKELVGSCCVTGSSAWCSVMAKKGRIGGRL